MLTRVRQQLGALGLALLLGATPAQAVFISEDIGSPGVAGSTSPTNAQLPTPPTRARTAPCASTTTTTTGLSLRWMAP